MQVLIIAGWVFVLSFRLMGLTSIVSGIGFVYHPEALDAVYTHLTVGVGLVVTKLALMGWVWSDGSKWS